MYNVHVHMAGILYILFPLLLLLLLLSLHKRLFDLMNDIAVSLS